MQQLDDEDRPVFSPLVCSLKAIENLTLDYKQKGSLSEDASASHNYIEISFNLENISELFFV